MSRNCPERLKTQFLDIFWAIFDYLVDAFVWWPCPMLAHYNTAGSGGVYQHLSSMRQDLCNFKAHCQLESLLAFRIELSCDVLVSEISSKTKGLGEQGAAGYCPKILPLKRAKMVLSPFHRSHREICTRNRLVSETKFLDDVWGPFLSRPLCFTAEKICLLLSGVFFGAPSLGSPERGVTPTCCDFPIFFWFVPIRVACFGQATWFVLICSVVFRFVPNFRNRSEQIAEPPILLPTPLASPGLVGMNNHITGWMPPAA